MSMLAHAIVALLVTAAAANAQTAQCEDVTKCSMDVTKCLMDASLVCCCYPNAAKCFGDADRSDPACKAAADTAEKGFSDAANRVRCGQGSCHADTPASIAPDTAASTAAAFAAAVAAALL
eukprot:CAMPEP_0198311800 /NCGR_PEP_ID=MMETSP1450-20131203/3416_1 /TAXON_ID=753684 ORGANISM="Madagascaria erythrocladiodes, Strain CCMP3234" /NCGR_SAMPLE_ID=MMETSP1450 /ASSEMBLY_ACC=CAM_ASM_001115 /LENGTH=120 /DNA_ID=CAMNT_0044014711 /DNA_START=123 /DNA_END=485 /DNA_ORIENTATION=-